MKRKKRDILKTLMGQKTPMQNTNLPISKEKTGTPKQTWTKNLTIQKRGCQSSQ